MFVGLVFVQCTPGIVLRSVSMPSADVDVPGVHKLPGGMYKTPDGTSKFISPHAYWTANADQVRAGFVLSHEFGWSAAVHPASSQICIWSAREERCVYSLQGNNSEDKVTQLLKIQGLLLSFHKSGRLVVWDVETKTHFAVTSAKATMLHAHAIVHAQFVGSAWNAGQLNLLTIDQMGEIRLWQWDKLKLQLEECPVGLEETNAQQTFVYQQNAQTSQPIPKQSWHVPSSIYKAAAWDEGAWLAYTSENQARVVNVVSLQNKELSPVALPAADSPISALLFPGEVPAVFVCALQGECTLWDVRTRESMYGRTFAHPVIHLAFIRSNLLQVSFLPSAQLHAYRPQYRDGYEYIKMKKNAEPINWCGVASTEGRILPQPAYPHRYDPIPMGLEARPAFLVHLPVQPGLQGYWKYEQAYEDMIPFSTKEYTDRPRSVLHGDFIGQKETFLGDGKGIVSLDTLRVQSLVRKETVEIPVYRDDAFVLTAGNYVLLQQEETGMLFDGHTGEKKKEIPLFAKKRELTSVALSGDGQLLFTQTLDGRARMWNVEKNQQTAFFEKGAFFLSPYFDKMARVLQDQPTSSNQPSVWIELWDISPQGIIKLQGTFDTHVGSFKTPHIQFSPEGNFLLIRHDTDKGSSTTLWQLLPNKAVFVKQFAGEGKQMPTDVHEEPQAAFVPSFERTAQLVVRSKGFFSLHDITTGALLEKVTDPTGKEGIYKVIASPYGTIACLLFDGTIRVWDVHAHRWTWTSLSFGNSVKEIRFVGNGKKLVVICDRPPPFSSDPKVRVFLHDLGESTSTPAKVALVDPSPPRKAPKRYTRSAAHKPPRSHAPALKVAKSAAAALRFLRPPVGSWSR